MTHRRSGYAWERENQSRRDLTKVAQHFVLGFCQVPPELI